MSVWVAIVALGLVLKVIPKPFNSVSVSVFENPQNQKTIKSACNLAWEESGLETLTFSQGSSWHYAMLRRLTSLFTFVSQVVVEKIQKVG